MRIEIKDADGVLHTQECDDYKYNVDTRTVLCYDKGEGDQTMLIAAFENVRHFRKQKEE